ncbi:MAG: hypothetical protein F4X13_15335 [Gammaproteobacteria bacterium]|nr:hypothetical protein [Gammaproteobacteria bacterium]
MVRVRARGGSALRRPRQPRQRAARHLHVVAEAGGPGAPSGGGGGAHAPSPRPPVDRLPGGEGPGLSGGRPAERHRRRAAGRPPAARERQSEGEPGLHQGPDQPDPGGERPGGIHARAPPAPRAGPSFRSRAGAGRTPGGCGRAGGAHRARRRHAHPRQRRAPRGPHGHSAGGSIRGTPRDSRDPWGTGDSHRCPPLRRAPGAGRRGHADDRAASLRAPADAELPLGPLDRAKAVNRPRRPQPVPQSATGTRSLSGKALVALSAVGPGLFLIGYNIGTGSITTMGMAGARYGMNLLWALVLSGIFTYVLMVAFGRLTLVTGRTALQSFKTGIPRVGKILALYVLAALVLGELVALTGVMGIVAELLQEGIRLVSPGDALVVPTGWIVLAAASAIFLMLWFGHYRLFEKVLTVFVILMVFCFVAVFFMVSPTYSAVVAGMVPSIPDTPDASRLVAAMAGTTCSAAVFIVRSTVVAEKGWTVDDLGREKRDALVSASVMVFLSAMVMAVAAGTLFVRGMTMESTLEMIGLLEPIGGDLAAFLLIVGISGAGLSTVFPLVLIAPWLVADYAGWKRDLRSRSSRLLIGLGLLFSFGSVFLEQTPPVLMVIAMALQAAILPAVAIPAFYLLNRREVMGEGHLATPGWNAGLIAVIAFSLVTTWFAVTGLLG